MTKDTALMLGLGALGAAVLAAVVYVGSTQMRPTDSQASFRSEMAMNQAANWPTIPRLATGLAIERYGPPDRVTPGRLEWDERQPWKRIALTDHPLSPLEQTVAYAVPAAMDAEVARFPHGVTIGQGGLELTTRSDREELNLLALNLVDEIARGKRSPPEADAFYLRTIELLAAGKSSPYTERLLFPTAPEREGLGLIMPGPAW
ncbi:MAG: hypothetical protein WC943_07375 [Elusimicrobiota bacterium]|jgi:hypothetical protein